MIRHIRQHIQLNDKGSALIISTFALTILLGLTACFTMASVGELNNSTRHEDSVEAFWAAEAAINRFIKNTGMLESEENYQTTLQIGDLAVLLKQDDVVNPGYRTVTATATSDKGVERAIEVQFAAGIPSVYDNTMATGGDIYYDGDQIIILIFPCCGDTSLTVNGQTRLSGEYTEGDYTDAYFEDMEPDIDTSLTTLTYPDIDGNEAADEFEDFREYYVTMTDVEHPDYTGQYTEDEVLYIPTDGTVDLHPASSLEGKKVIFVDGGTAGEGHARIWLDTSWAQDENMTVVATGDVSFIEPLDDPDSNSRLNVVAWQTYSELSALAGYNAGMYYSHGDAYVGFGGFTSTTDGSIIANDGLEVSLTAGGDKVFNYITPLDDEGFLPPGFQQLLGGGSSGYSDTPSSWTEI